MEEDRGKRKAGRALPARGRKPARKAPPPTGRGRRPPAAPRRTPRHRRALGRRWWCRRGRDRAGTPGSSGRCAAWRGAVGDAATRRQANGWRRVRCHGGRGSSSACRSRSVWLAAARRSPRADQHGEAKGVLLPPIGWEARCNRPAPAAVIAAVQMWRRQ